MNQLMETEGLAHANAAPPPKPGKHICSNNTNTKADQQCITTHMQIETHLAVWATTHNIIRGMETNDN